MAAPPARHGSLAAWAFGLLFLLVGLGGVAGAWGAYLTDTRIERDGPRASGQLQRKSFLPAVDGSSDYVLEYRFQPQSGPALQVSRNVSKELWQSVHEGQQLEIRYARDDPGRNFPAGGGVTAVGVTLFVSLVSALLGLFGAALVWGQLRTSRHEA